MKLSLWSALSYVGVLAKLGGAVMLYVANRDEQALAMTLAAELYDLLNDLLKGNVKKRVDKANVETAAQALAVAVKDAMN
jgi:hypothetical protein